MERCFGVGDNICKFGSLVSVLIVEVDEERENGGRIIPKLVL